MLQTISVKIGCRAFELNFLYPGSLSLLFCDYPQKNKNMCLMVGVGFHVHHVVVCQRLLLCFLTPIFCDSCGNSPGEKCHGGAVDFKVLPACVSPWDCGKQEWSLGGGLSSFWYHWWIYLRGWWCLAECCTLRKGLISLRKAAGGPFGDIQA